MENINDILIKAMKSNQTTIGVVTTGMKYVHKAVNKQNILIFAGAVCLALMSSTINAQAKRISELEKNLELVETQICTGEVDKYTKGD